MFSPSPSYLDLGEGPDKSNGGLLTDQLYFLLRHDLLPTHRYLEPFPRDSHLRCVQHCRRLPGFVFGGEMGPETSPDHGRPGHGCMRVHRGRHWCHNARQHNGKFGRHRLCLLLHYLFRVEVRYETKSRRPKFLFHS